MHADEKTVKKYLEGRGLQVERFSKVEIRNGRTPDFRVLANEHLSFYCEVKSSPPDIWLDDQLQDAALGDIVGGVRNDPTFNRLTSDIHSAVKQFDSVNKNQENPNVLALVNHDKSCDFGDLLAVLTGNFYTDKGTSHPIYRKFSEGRIKQDKNKIHLFIWLEDNEPERLFFTGTNTKHHATLCSSLGIRSDEIKQVPF